MMVFLMFGFAGLSLMAENNPADYAGDSNIASIDGDCEANFIYQEITPGLAMFINISIPPDQLEYQWDFGDGQTSTEMNPIHAYDQPGNYQVCLSISDSAFQCEDTFCEEVTVSESYECEADFTYEINNFSPGTVLFTDVSLGFPDTWYWDFGDGNFSMLPEVEHIYNAPGEYTVSLTISNQSLGCEDTYSEIIVIDTAQPCQAGFDFVPVINELRTFQFFDESIGDIQIWQWDFGDGTQSFEQNPIHVFEQPGMYEVCLTVIDVSGECVSVFCELVDANGNSSDCEADFSFMPDSLDSQTIHFLDESLGDYNEWFWDFGDGTTSVEQFPEHTYEDPGIYPVCLTISDSLGFCYDVFCMDVEVFSNDCFADFSFVAVQGDPFSIQFNDLSSPGAEIYLWDFGDGNTDSIQNPVHQFQSEGEYQVCLTIFDLFRSCWDTTCKIVTIPMQADCEAAFDYIQEPADPFQVIFVDESVGEIASWFWDFGDGNMSDEPSPVHVYEEEGVYEVCLEVTDASGSCTSIYCEEIVVETPELCIADFGFEVLPDEILTVSFTDLSEGPINAWSWDFGDGSISTEQNPVHVFADTGNYIVSLTAFNSDSLNHCYDSVAQQVQVYVDMPDCEANFIMHPDSGVNKPLFFHFHDISENQPDTWLWDFGDGNTSTIQNPVHQYEEAGEYEVSLTVTKINLWGDDCVDTKTEIMQTPDYFHIGGFVYAGNFPINNPEHTGDTAMVYLYRYHDDNNVISIDTSVVIEYGYFHALFLLEDHYMIKFRLTDGSANAPYYFPTYFGDKKRWQHSPTLFLADSSHYNVNVSLAEIPDPEGGVGAINGIVTHHSNADAQVPAHDSEILIFNSANQAVAYKYSDEDGEFTFDNLAFDTYTLYAESTGLFTDPVTVTISETFPTAFDVQLELFDSDPTSLQENLGMELSGLEVFPNPANDRITVKTDLSGDLRIAVKDLTGREILAFNHQQNNGQTTIDISALTKGIYFLQVSSLQFGFSESKKFVKVSD